MTKSVPRISLLVQHSHKLFKTKAQYLSIILFLILPQRVRHLLFFSPAFYHLMHTLLSAVPLYCFTQSCTISHKLKWKYGFVHSAADQHFFLLSYSFYSLYFLNSFLPLIFSNKNKTKNSLEACRIITNGCCILITPLTHSLIVIITCTQLPLPSHWSRSPDSCPCSLQAPEHIQKSPYKCSHISHLQSLLTLSGRGTL